MDNINYVCPVCNSVRTDNSSIACKKCGCGYAFCEFFGGEKAYQTWKMMVEQHKSAYVGALCKESREIGSSLAVSGDRICFYDAQEKRAVTFRFGSAQPEITERVKQVSLSGLYRVFLHTDGALSSSGDDESGQRRLNDLKDIVYVSTAPKCTYAVKADGTVAVRGATAFKSQVEKWTDIKSIASEEGYVVALKADGRVVYAAPEGSSMERHLASTAEWKNVRKLATSAHYMLALHADGSVSYAGGPGTERSKVSEWKNIQDIAADGQYAVGLSADGRVLLAGDYTQLIDFGRKEAGSWTDMVFVAAGRSVIAGVSATGELRMVGNIIRDDSLRQSFKDMMCKAE